MQSSSATTKCKVVLLGDQSVGKTSIINRFIFDNFTGNQQPTVGVDFVSKTINVDNKTLRMQLWDTAGQQRFHSLIPSYIKDCSAAIVVFDLTNQVSFNNVGKWIDSVKEVRGEDALIMVAGNKADLKTDVDESLAKAAVDKLKELGLTYMPVSAKSGENIKQFFKELAFLICGGSKKQQQKQTSTQQSKTPTKTFNPITENTNAKSVNLNATDFKQGKQKKDKKKCC